MPEEAGPPSESDRSNGWEAVAPWFTAYGQRSTVGTDLVQAWAETLPPGAVVLDLGCGPGTPRSGVLASRGFAIHAVDASPTLAAAYQRRFPRAQVECAPIEDSTFFGERFDGVLAWGIMFLLAAEAQRGLIHRVANVLQPGGALLFTAPAQECTWQDMTTGQQSLSLGASAYRRILADAGLRLRREHDDEGENHYYEAFKP